MFDSEYCSAQNLAHEVRIVQNHIKRQCIPQSMWGTLIGRKVHLIFVMVEVFEASPYNF